MAATGSGSGDALYYISGTLLSFGTLAWGARLWWRSQKAKWTSEGEERRKSTEAMEANTKAAQENTKAIGDLAEKFDQFSGETRTTLNGHEGRIIRLEDAAPWSRRAVQHGGKET